MKRLSAQSIARCKSLRLVAHKPKEQSSTWSLTCHHVRFEPFHNSSLNSNPRHGINRKSAFMLYLIEILLQTAMLLERRFLRIFKRPLSARYRGCTFLHSTRYPCLLPVPKLRCMLYTLSQIVHRRKFSSRSAPISGDLPSLFDLESA